MRAANRVRHDPLLHTGAIGDGVGDGRLVHAKGAIGDRAPQRRKPRFVRQCRMVHLRTTRRSQGTCAMHTRYAQCSALLKLLVSSVVAAHLDIYNIVVDEVGSKDLRMTAGKAMWRREDRM